MPKISIGTDILSDFQKGINKEWITTNGLGGYASSSVIGCNTRRYHGLLVTSGGDGHGRNVLLSKMDETVQIGRKYYYLSTNQYQENYVHPRGYAHLRKFEQTPFPKFIYTIDDLVITKEIFMPRGTKTTIIRYNLFGGRRNFTFFLHPLVSFVNFHELQKENRDFNTWNEFSNNTLRMAPYEDMPELKLHIPGMEYKGLKNWYKNYVLEKEKERGLDYVGDLFNPGYFYSPEASSMSIDVIATCDDTIPTNIDTLYREARDRVDDLFDLANAAPNDPDEHSLVLAADLHVVGIPLKDGKNRSTIVAGYHWFGDWGRDTFIALPGITLCTGRFEEARDILHSFALQCKDGIIPNRFADIGDEAIYNTVDASLWYINAVQEYIKYTGDYDFVKGEVFETCKSIMGSYEKGTLFGIKMDEDCLVSAGEEGSQLTWMDAKVGDWVVTPRMGKPVEINALWFNALCIMADLSAKFEETDLEKHYRETAEKTKKSFNEKFWNQRENCLYDVITDNLKDASFRPNQVFAVSLPFPVLDEDKQVEVISRVYESLYTPFGMRSLSPDNPNYKGIHKGTILERDGAYHQGIGWCWLMGPFIEAYLKVHKYSKEAVMQADTLMDLWMGELTEGGMNTLSELVDGDEPFASRGCISQAWSIGEALRLKKIINRLLQDLKGKSQEMQRM